MDVEADLIRAGNWSELKRYYTSQAGHAWELAWVQLLKMRDVSAATEQFTKALQDPRYEEAAHILLWYLGKRPQTKALEGPPSLRVADAFMAGRPAVLLKYLEDSASHSIYLPFLFRNLAEKMSLRELAELEKYPRPA